MNEDFMNFPDDPCKNCVTTSPCFESAHCPELSFDLNCLLDNIWHIYKMCKSKASELDLHFRLFVEFKEEITERYNYLHGSNYTSMELLNLIVSPYYDVDNELYVLRTIFVGSGIDLSQLNQIIGAKEFSSLYDMKTYDTFYNVFIDRSNYYAFIDSLVHFIFD